MDLKVLTLLVACFMYLDAASLLSQDDKKYITTVLEQVPVTDRQAFVIHQLYKGYLLNNPNDIAITVPEETTRKMYEFFRRNFLISPVDKTVAFSQLCFPSGECVDTDDPGVYP